MSTQMTGRRFGLLVVTRRASADEIPADRYRHDSAIWWMTKCDCGAQRAVNTSRLGRGVTSCGCRSGRTLPLGESAKRSLFSWYKQMAKRRGKVFSLTLTEFVKLVESPCSYCGGEPRRSWAQQRNAQGRPKYNGTFLYTGVDRVDSALGYVSANCVPCCTTCNQAKNDRSVAEFRAWIKRIHDFQFPMVQEEA